MKPIEQLTNVERAKLLHQLLPRPIPDFLDYAKRMIVLTRTNAVELAQTWCNQFFTFDAWMKLGQYAEKRIDKYGAQLAKSSRLFADQLFDVHTALWSADTLLKYVNQPGYSDPKFTGLVTALFSYQPQGKAGAPEFVQRYNTLGVDAATFIWQKVAAAKKLTLYAAPEKGQKADKNSYERLPFFTYFSRPGRHESVAITELETTDGKEVHIKGVLIGDHYPKRIAINLDELDCPSALYLADYLSARSAS